MKPTGDMGRFTARDDLMPIGDALALLAARVGPVAAVEEVPVSAALGRILAADVTAEISVPPHDNSAVDGFALWFDDLDAAADTRLPVSGRIAAGHPFRGEAKRGTALRIFTGAPMPAGPDTVVMQEDCRVEGDLVMIRQGLKLKRGDNRRFAGEDVNAGDVVLRAGARIRPQEMGLAAAIGRPVLVVRRPLRAAVFSTGDEVRDPGRALPPGGIYDSNRYSIAGLLQGLGCTVTDLGILPDRFEAIRDALAGAANGHDVVVTSGGVSLGEEDHVKAAVQAEGSLHFWRLAIKPGRPVALGEVRGVPFVGLPGNPVAVMVTFLLLARPLILRLAGATAADAIRYPVPAAFAYRKKPGRREFLRGLLVAGPGGLMVDKFAADGSGILSSMTTTDGLVDLPENLAEVVPGQPVDFLPFAEVLR